MLRKPDLNKPAFKFNKYWRELIENNKCPICGTLIKEKEFKNEISKKEYSISGQCQMCQDEVFGR